MITIEDACNLLNEMMEVDYPAMAAMTNTSWDAHLPHHAVEYTQLGADTLRFNFLSVLNGMFGATGYRIAVKVIEGRLVYLPEPCNPDEYKKDPANAAASDSQDH